MHLMRKPNAIRIQSRRQAFDFENSTTHLRQKAVKSLRAGIMPDLFINLTDIAVCLVFARPGTREVLFQYPER